MTRQKFVLAATAAFAFSIGSAWAQERTAPTQDTPPSGGPSRGGGGEAVGRAVERSDPSPSSSSSGSSGGSSATSPSSGSGGFDAPSRASEPRRSVDAPERSQQRAVPRGSSGGSDSGGRTAGTASTRGESGVDRSGERRGERSADRSNDRGRDAVPVYARPREGRPAVGSASERRGSIPGRGTIDVLYYPSSYYYYDPYYLRSRYYGSYWLPGYGYGLGYFGYDPFFFSNYGYNSGYGSPYYGGGGGGYSGYAYPAQRYETGSVRLKVKPAHGQVYVDGYFVGEVDSFDGVFQRLSVEAGTHRIEIRAEGYEPVQFDVMVTPGETVTYKGEMIRRQP